jgi:peptide-methionine (R)-S-oxide reductase
MEKIVKTEDQWREELSPEAYAVLRRQATEPPFTGKYTYDKTAGVFRCAGCNAEIFRSDDKFDSGCGWPSFWQPLVASSVVEKRDASHGMVRFEVRSKLGDSHLGHVFDDGPTDRGGQRYCINSVALELEADGSA